MKSRHHLLCAATTFLLISACSDDKTANRSAPADEQVSVDMNMTNDPANPFAEAEMQMHDRMVAAKGATNDETWIRKMIEHHRGAVAMSDVILAGNPSPEVRTMAQKTRSDQMKEIEHLEAMLAGDKATAAAPASNAPPAPADKTAPKEKAKTAPKAAPKADAKAATQAPADSPACEPEHRALGHC